MKKIIIVGTSGCGKTTLAKQLEQITAIPHSDLDDFYWLPNWQPNLVFFETKLNAFLNRDQWIISGNYSKNRPLMWQQADTIIWLDYSLSRCLYQGFRRSLIRIIRREACCNGNYETFKRTFTSKDSLIYWIFKTFYRRKKQYSEVFESTSLKNKHYLRFKNPRQTNQWLASLNN